MLHKIGFLALALWVIVGGSAMAEPRNMPAELTPSDGVTFAVMGEPILEEGCCGDGEPMDEDYAFMGYTPDMWDMVPVAADFNCASSQDDDRCFSEATDRILGLLAMGEILEQKAEEWRRQHVPSSVGLLADRG